MPNLMWSRLNRLQLGRYGEYYAKMEFASYGFDVYTSEVDDHGVDFVARDPVSGKYYEVQVKSVREYTYVYSQKDKMPISPDRMLCLLRFENGSLPECYIIPSIVWLAPNDLFVDRPYGKEGQTSKPEWGINLSKKNMHILKAYNAEAFFSKINMLKES